jgi:cytochrome c biogenesis protein
MRPLKNPDGSVVAMRLSPGDVFTLPNGQGSIQLDGWVRWVKLQVGNSPGAAVSLTAIGFAVLGLCLSLFVRPRRVWVRIRKIPSEGSTAGEISLVEVAGLDRADARAGLTEDVAELSADLTEGRRAGPIVTEQRESSRQ